MLYIILSLIAAHYATAEPLKHKKLSLDLQKPFYWIQPSSVELLHYTRKRSQPSQKSAITGTLKPRTLITLPADHNFNQPWIKLRGSFVAFDAYNTSTSLPCKKVAESTIHLNKSTSITASFSYINHKNYYLAIKDQSGAILLERQSSDPSVNIARSHPIALYTIATDPNHPTGWGVIHGNQMIILFPHIGEDKRLRIFSYHIQYSQKGPLSIQEYNGAITWKWSEPSEPEMVFELIEDHTLRIWDSKSINIGRDAISVSMPSIHSITLPSKGHPPSIKDVLPPSTFSDWPKGALATWSPIRLFLFTLIYQLTTLKAQVLCSIPQSFWDYARSRNKKDLSAFTSSPHLQKMIDEEITFLKAYLPETPISLEALLLVTPPSPQEEKHSTVSRIMVLLDAD